MTNEEIIEKIRTTLAEEFEVGIDVIQQIGRAHV